MRTLQEAEAWAREHSATLKVNYAEGIATLQVSGFVAHSNQSGPLSEVLPDLVERVEQQMSDRLTQPEPISADLAQRARQRCPRKGAAVALAVAKLLDVPRKPLELIEGLANRPLVRA